ncbi:EF-hand domain-containing protein [Xanthobacter agilis]|uniref:EF-hand domain-containing protein n=1 Tax=Xanthobacter agilis TaxID=47492 RepID=A0ABU0LH04_XANAG|nr:hypothetical protein [Xanthobacter agilis]MDQ0506431.1 hypothetical protein [Xanthobacter agilis]
MDRSNNVVIGSNPGVIYGFGLWSSVGGVGLLHAYPEIRFSWAFYPQPNNLLNIGPTAIVREILELGDVNIIENRYIAPDSILGSVANDGIAKNNFLNHEFALNDYLSRVNNDRIAWRLTARADVPILRNVRGAPRWMDAVYLERHWWSGSELNYVEIKTGGSLSNNKKVINQAISDVNNQFRLKYSRDKMIFRPVGKWARNGGATIGVAALAWDVYSTSSAVIADAQAGDNISAGREIAGFGGRLAGAIAVGQPLAAFGFGLAGPVGALVAGAVGGAFGAYLGGDAFSAAYSDVARLLTVETPNSALANISSVDIVGSASQGTNATDFSFATPWGGDVTSAVDWAVAEAPQISISGPTEFSGSYGFGDYGSGDIMLPEVSVVDYGSYDFSSWYVGDSSFSFDLSPANNPNDYIPPVVLDLNGDGVSIIESTDSDTYMDMEGDGTQHRTAWAGAGDGVLVYDRTGSGDVDNPQAFQFTQYSPGAESDMEALADVFDTNGDGKLSAADDEWSKFKVLVTNSNNSKVLKTLAELGITEISVTPDDNEQSFSDGSQILGSATFVRNGSTYAARWQQARAA